MLYILCLNVFFARIFDVSLGTFRTILTVKNKIIPASIVGFVEVLIWFLVVREALSSNESGIFIAIAYASGYATGTLLGGVLARKFIITPVSVQIITSKNIEEVIKKLKSKKFGCSIVDVTGYDKKTPKKMIITETTSKRIKELKKIVLDVDEHAFVVINETKYIQNGFLK